MDTILFLLFLCVCCYFSFFIALARAPSTTLKGLVKKESLALILILGEKHSLLHTICDVSCRFVVDAFLSSQEIPLLFLACLMFLS